MAFASAIASSSLANEIDRRDRAEDLLALHARVGGHAGEHGRLVEVAGAVARRAADEHLGALADGVLDELLHAVARGLVDQRTGRDARCRCRARARARASARRAAARSRRRPTRGRGSGWRSCTPRRCCASSRASRPRRRGRGPRPRSTRNGRVAAELHRHPQQLLGRLLDELLADRGRPGERELARTRVADQRLHQLTRLLRRDDVAHAGGQARLLEDLRHREHRQRRLLRRLDDASCSRRRSPGRPCACPSPAGSSTA